MSFGGIVIGSAMLGLAAASSRRQYDLIVEDVEYTERARRKGLRDRFTRILVDIDMGEFFVNNDLDPEDISAILELDVGEEYSMGGGAAPIFRIKRVR